MAAVTAFLALSVALVGLLLAVMTILTAVRVRAARFAFAAVAFSVFTVRGALVIGDGEGWFTSPMAYNEVSVALDAVVLGLLYFAIVKG